MSLTTWIKREDVRTHMDAILPKYTRSLKVPMVVSPAACGRAVVGTAFDYALRLELQRRRPDSKCAPLVAHHAMLIARDRLSSRVIAEYARIVSFLARLHRVCERLSVATRRELAQRCVQLAYLDVIIRAGLIHFDEGDFLSPEPADVAQVASLLRAAPIRDFESARRIILNPTFGRYSRLVGGADADLVCDDRLIDIKTTQAAIVEREHARQILGYFLLSRWALRDGDGSLPPISRLEIYFSRYATTWRMETAEILSQPDFGKHEMWLRDNLQQGQQQTQLGRPTVRDRRRSRREQGIVVEAASTRRVRPLLSCVNARTRSIRTSS